MGLGPKIFVRKNGNQKGGKLYKWSPREDGKKARKDTARLRANSNYFCTTPLGSQGNDFKVTYTYVVVVVGGKQEKHAYVQCDYVQ